LILFRRVARSVKVEKENVQPTFPSTASFSVAPEILTILHIACVLAKDKSQVMSFLPSLSSGITVGEVAGFLSLGAALGINFILYSTLHICNF
jgi:hypothetical protein